MSDSQDIFLLILVILFMANAQDGDNDSLSNINSVILILLLFGTFESRCDDRVRRCRCNWNNF